MQSLAKQSPTLKLNIPEILLTASVIPGAGDPDPPAGRPLPADPDGPQQVGVPGGLHRVPDLPGHRALHPGEAQL